MLTGTTPAHPTPPATLPVPPTPHPFPQARCNGTTQLNEVAQAYDWRDSSPAEGVYNLLVWYNASRRVSTSGYRPTTIVRVNQVGRGSWGGKVWMRVRV